MLGIRQPEEEKRGFFVAFSRAIENVILTFSEVRIGRFGRQRQRKSQIDDLYAILRLSGIKIIDFEDNRSISSFG